LLGELFADVPFAGVALLGELFAGVPFDVVAFVDGCEDDLVPDEALLAPAFAAEARFGLGVAFVDRPRALDAPLVRDAPPDLPRCRAPTGTASRTVPATAFAAPAATLTAPPAAPAAPLTARPATSAAPAAPLTARPATSAAPFTAPPAASATRATCLSKPAPGLRLREPFLELPFRMFAISFSHLVARPSCAIQPRLSLAG
jgi:hypothetical protein